MTSLDGASTPTPHLVSRLAASSEPILVRQALAAWRGGRSGGLGMYPRPRPRSPPMPMRLSAFISSHASHYRYLHRYPYIPAPGQAGYFGVCRNQKPKTKAFDPNPNP